VSIALFGRFGSSLGGTFQVVLDNGEPADVFFADPFIILQVFYTSPLLDNAMHNVVFRKFDPVVIDYAIVQVENDTPLLGHNVIVGSGDPGIQYHGSWFTNSSTLRGGFERQRPFGNSTVQTSASDSSFRFQFYGTFISVVGISPITDCKSVWIFDGQDRTIQHAGDIGSPNTNFEWISMNFAFAGNHTLEFSRVSTGLFTLDYIIYTPSTRTPETQTNGTNVAGSTSLRPTLTPTTISISTTTHRLSNAGIAGVVIGATAGLAAILLVLILMCIKRRAKQAGMESIEQVSELAPSDMIEHKSSISGVSIDQTRENNIEACYILPNSLDGVEHRSAFRRIVGAITHPNRLAHDAHIVPAINEHIQVIQAQDAGEDADDATSMTATVVVQEGDARSRAEHLRRLMAEIQRELAESDSMTNVND
ncbi:hypothetical protein DXG01_014725, partial [Tephrocybe rancida]